MRVLKFGGSSLATPEAILQVVEIVRAARSDGEVAVVVSAFGGVTNQLGELAESGRGGDGDLESRLELLERRHMEAVDELAAAGERPVLAEETSRRMAELRDLLRGVGLVGEVSARTLDRIQACGELLSAPIVAAALRRGGIAAEWIDARRLIVTDASYGQARPDLEATAERVRRHFADAAGIQVLPGFVAATVEEETVTLGRGGSDFTASILAAALGASALELWTDVSGVMTADPRLVPEARPISRLRYDELMEMSHFGAKVVHPPSVQPVHRLGISLWIKNTFEPEAPGTLIGDSAGSEGGEEQPIRGITSIRRVAMARLEGDGMVGVPGVAMRLFRALAERGVSVILISQASSEHSICFCVAPEDLPRTRQAIAAEFDLDRRAGDIDELAVEEGVSIVAVIGAAMREQPGIAGRLFSVLGAEGINVRAIAQGSSELNISLVVAGSDEGAAVRSIHQAFFRRPDSSRPAARLFLAGVGGVGGELLRQLGERETMLTTGGLVLRLEGVADSRRVLLDDRGIEPARAVEELAAAEASGLDRLLAAAVEPSPDGLSPRIFVDCTAAEGMIPVYERVLAAGGAVVTANKKPFAAPTGECRRLFGAVYQETTVGAGLPVLRTLADLLATGDRLTAFEGVLSGTASFLAGEINGGARLSRAVQRAAELGYLEPDPRDDLGGFDAARKLLIVARLAGAELEWSELELEPVVPREPYLELPAEEVMGRLPELDESFAVRRDEERRAGRRLVYLAWWREGRAGVGWRAVDGEHPCFDLAPGENLASFSTRRYDAAPLVVRGPGAGPGVTAAGVFADILRAAAEHGPRPAGSANVLR